MQIGRLAPHVPQDEPFVAFLGELRQFDSSTVRPQATNDLPVLDGIVWIRLPNCAFEQPNRKGALLRPSMGPAPSRGQPRFRFARDQTAIALGSRHVSRSAEAADPGDTVRECDFLSLIGKGSLQQPLNALRGRHAREFDEFGPEVRRVTLCAKGHFA